MHDTEQGHDTTRLRGYAWLLLALVVFALGARLLAAFAQHSVVPEYPSYYATVADELAHGHGLTVPYAWSYMTPALDNGLGLPRPAFEVWLPAAALVQVPFAVLFGGTVASKLAGALTGALLVLLVAILARRTARATGRSARAADVFSLVAALLVAITVPLVTGSISSDSQALFGVTTIAGVLAVERAIDSGRHRDTLLAGLVLGAGLLTRNETVFLLAAALVAVAWPGHGTVRTRVTQALLLGGAAVACYVPWALRQWVVFGTPLPSQTAANAFSLNPQDIYGWSAPLPTLATYLAAGPAALVEQRVTAFGHNAFDVLLGPALPWSIIGLVGVVLLARARPLRLLIATSLIVFLLDTLVFPVATLFGTYLHGSAPALALLAIGASEVAFRVHGLVTGTGRLTSGQRGAGAVGFSLAGLAVIGWLAVSTVTGVRDYATWANAIPVRYAALSATLSQVGLGQATVIASHPGWVWRETGQPALVLPDEDAASILSLAAAYGAEVVAVDGADGRWPSEAASTACLVPVPLPPAAAPLTAWFVRCTTGP